MEIEDRRKTGGKLPVGAIQDGRVFDSGGEIFIKSDSREFAGSIRCVRLRDGLAHLFDPGVSVTPVKARLTIEGDQQ